MKILSKAQIYEADQATIQKEGITSTELMERASEKCVDWILGMNLNQTKRIHIFCGTGNNGGDGLVISRLLLGKGFNIETYIVNFSKKRSSDFQINLNKLVQTGHVPKKIRDSSTIPEIFSGELIIDAIFGIGLTRPPEGIAKEVIQKINQSGVKVIAIDFPSGLFAESPIAKNTSVVKADYTLTFQNPKLAFFMPDNQAYIKDWTILDIGLDQPFINSLDGEFSMIDQSMIKGLLKERPRFSHKGSYGHSLLIGGSFGKIGAAILASKAALKAGSGLVSAFIPKCGYTAMQGSNPEVMVEVDDENYIQYFNYKTKPNAIGIGMGLGMHLKTKKGFVAFLKKCRLPMVIDADGLNIIAEYDELSDLINEDSILTPHPKEFERLVGSWNNDFEKLEKQRKFSEEHKCLIVLKGAYTTIAYRNKIYFNATGNAGLATAGSGDVLTGIITGLLAQGYSTLEAALVGVYIHGRSADLGIATKESMESFIASDCVNLLGSVFNELKNSIPASI
jgi:hydroxyethylthiazole kinase-like uncharacterized protein yjeF